MIETRSRLQKMFGEVAYEFGFEGLIRKLKVTREIAQDIISLGKLTKASVIPYPVDRRHSWSGQPPHCWAVASSLSIKFIHSILEYSNL